MRLGENILLGSQKVRQLDSNKANNHELEEAVLSICLPLIKKELQDVVFAPQLKKLEVKMKQYFGEKIETISQLISRVGVNFEDGYRSSMPKKRHFESRATADHTGGTGTAQSSLKKTGKEIYKREKTVDPFPVTEVEEEGSRLMWTLNGRLPNIHSATERIGATREERSRKKTKRLKSKGDRNKEMKEGRISVAS